MNPGYCIYVDQLESPTRGLIYQLKGRHTNNHYHTETIFTEHYSDLLHVNLQKSLNSEETVQSNKEFLAYNQKLGLKIRYYHDSNGKDKYNELMQSDKCEIHMSHFRKDKAEKRIRDLHEQTFKQIHQDKAVWSNDMELSLQTYELVRPTIPAIYYLTSNM